MDKDHNAPKHILLVEGFSNGLWYIDDAIAMGLVPVVLYAYREFEDKHLNTRYTSAKNSVRVHICDKAEIIDVLDKKEIIKILSKYNIKYILPGSDLGVPLTDILNDRLGLRGNSPGTTKRRVDKYCMHHALKDAGIRYIKSIVINDESDIDKFWKENSLSSAVIKPTVSTGTVGVHICDSAENCKEKYLDVKKQPGAYEINAGNILIQEFISGTEYAVNSMSCDGVHKITDIWKYNKIKVDDGRIACDCGISMSHILPGVREMCLYALKVLDAVDFKNGPCHTEIMIDKKGPVLMEVNARPMGSICQNMLDEAIGHHITNLCLDAYINPNKFKNKWKLNLPKQMIHKTLIVTKDANVYTAPFTEFTRHLRSNRNSHTRFLGNGKERIVKTCDAMTSPGTITFYHDDWNVTLNDMSLFSEVELKYPDLIYDTVYMHPATDVCTDISCVTSTFTNDKEYLIVTDSGMKRWSKGGNVDSYDGSIIALRGEFRLQDRIKVIADAVSSVKVGGKIWVMPETYAEIPYGSTGMELLFTLFGVNILLPDDMNDKILSGICNRTALCQRREQ